MRAIIDPAPQLGALFTQLVLYVNFSFDRVHLEAEIDTALTVPSSRSAATPPIEEIFGKVRVAEEQPCSAFRPFRRTLLHKGAERRDAGAGANHTTGASG